MWQRREGSRPVVICRLNSLFILPEYFEKYLYLSTFETTTFYIYSSTFLVSALYFTSSRFFFSNEIFTKIEFSSTFYTTGGQVSSMANMPLNKYTASNNSSFHIINTM